MWAMTSPLSGSRNSGSQLLLLLIRSLRIGILMGSEGLGARLQTLLAVAVKICLLQRDSVQCGVY
jgi:hypothetical protein